MLIMIGFPLSLNFYLRVNFFLVRIPPRAGRRDCAVEPGRREVWVHIKLEEDLKNAAVGIHRYETLKEGLQWPEGVDPTKRETYLSEEEFITVFKGISKADFAKLSQYRKNQKKKDVSLF